MKKTVIFEFPNDFRFPEKWGFPQCDGCPFDISMDDEPLCFLTGDSDCWPSVYDKRKLLGKKIPSTFSAFQELKYSSPDKWEELKKLAQEKRKRINR